MLSLPCRHHADLDLHTIQTNAEFLSLKSYLGYILKVKETCSQMKDGETHFYSFNVINMSKNDFTPPTPLTEQQPSLIHSGLFIYFYKPKRIQFRQGNV